MTDPRPVPETFFSNRPLIIPCAVACSMLLSALGKHKYDFYTLLRWVVCMVAVWVAVVGNMSTHTWAVAAFAVVAVLFNPLIPIHLSRETWAPIDIGTALLFVVAAVTIQTSTSDGS